MNLGYAPSEMLSKLVWGLKQLFPLTYRSHYTEKGKKHFVVWNMWFGRCFNIEDFLV
jgi:hypothetical protein